MSQIHTSYKVSKALKEFLGESAPEPMVYDWYEGESLLLGYDPLHGVAAPCRIARVKKLVPAYQLHDLLSKPFCEAFTDALERINGYCPVESNKDLSMELAYKNYFGGLPAVEKALMEMISKGDK